MVPTEIDMENLSDAEKLGKLIKNARESEGVSQDYVASMALGDMSRKSEISRLENAKNKAVTPETVRKVATVLKIDPADIPECYRWPAAIALLIAKESSNAIEGLERERAAQSDQTKSSSPTPPREQEQIDTQEFPSDDIRLAYENLDWNEHWLLIVGFAAERGDGEVRQKAYDALAKLVGIQARQLIEDRSLFIAIDEEAFKGLEELRMASIRARGPSVGENIINLSFFMFLLYAGISLIGSGTGIGALEAITPSWFGEYFVFVPIAVMGTFFWGLCVMFRSYLLNPVPTEKKVMLTEMGEQFVQNDVKPALADYLRRKKL